MIRYLTIAATAYLVAGLLTLAHWEFVWMKDMPFTDQWSRADVTIMFGPHVVATWPAYWVAMYDLGTWAWWPT